MKAPLLLAIATASYPHGAEIAVLVAQEQGITKDAWLTETGHKRPGIAKGMPLAQAEEKSKALETQIHALASNK